MILTDIPAKIKGLPDISHQIFTIVMGFLVISGIGLSYGIYEREVARGGDLRVISTGGIDPSGISSSSSSERTAGQSETSGSYLASRSGKYFYLPKCAGAKRIKEKNRVWFQSKEDATAHGYKPAGNCSP